LCAGLADAGFGVLRPAGTYFVTADITPLGGIDGVEFCRSLPERCGVVAVPTQVFYDDVAAGRRLIRFAFCKRDEVLDEAVARLRKLSAA
jgi:N-succinyldiaminopimelate aminotransferase